MLFYSSNDDLPFQFHVERIVDWFALRTLNDAALNSGLVLCAVSDHSQ